jgi:hypothetical protein
VSGGKRLIQISAPISPGSSGSPVVNMKGTSWASRRASPPGFPHRDCRTGRDSSRPDPSSPSPVAKLPVLYAGSPWRSIRRRSPGMRIAGWNRRGSEPGEQARSRRSDGVRDQQIGEATDLLDKARHNLSFDRLRPGFQPVREALQIFRASGRRRAWSSAWSRWAGSCTGEAAETSPRNISARPPRCGGGCRPASPVSARVSMSPAARRPVNP